MVLRLMLTSLHRAMEGLTCEVFVVDNASNDGTVDYLKEHYPWLTLIANEENVGFPRANNMALERCTGNVVLVLNPDTVVPKHFLHDIVAHFDNNADAGAVGVQMTDGTGRYLPESKRGYTDLRTSFFKLTYLWHLFPKSPIFNNYYLGQYDKDKVCFAPSLSGACMAFKRELMQRVGMFDTAYFMYCEDNDLSYRMNNASAGNMYRGDLHVIHFKGACTPPRMQNIRYFYKSMLLFASKYEYPKRSAATNAIVYCGIKLAFAIASVRCLITRIFQSNYVFNLPKSILLITDNPLCSQWFNSSINKLNGRVRTEPTSSLPNITSDDAGMIIFDIEGDIDAVIATMQRLHGHTTFGFCSVADKTALAYAGNMCRPLF